MDHLASTGFKVSVVATHEDAVQLDDFKPIADTDGAQCGSPGCALQGTAPRLRELDVAEIMRPPPAHPRRTARADYPG
jgi:hypothetical protein